RDGAAAARGRVMQAALASALAHPYFTREGPRSTGREEFGAAFATRLLAEVKNAGGSLDDAIATATALTVESIARALDGGSRRDPSALALHTHRDERPRRRDGCRRDEDPRVRGDARGRDRRPWRGRRREPALVTGPAGLDRGRAPRGARRQGAGRDRASERGG